jgi:hypothetical protein
MIRRNGGAEPGRDKPRRGASFDRTPARRLVRIASHYGRIPGGVAFTAFTVNTGSS